MDKQHRRFLGVRLDAHAELRKHVGPVEVVGDAPEAFGLALRAIDALAAVEAGERLVGFGVADGLDFKREGFLRQALDGEVFVRDPITRCVQLVAANRNADELEHLAIELQHASLRFRRRVGANRKP